MELEGSILFIGTATVLIRFGGFTLLTDPNFLHRHETIRLGYGLRAHRLTEPALSIDMLPPVDVCVLSHLHEDHFDRVAEERLPRSLPIVTTPHAARHLGDKGFADLQPVRTWQSRVFRRGPATLEVTALPARHGPLVVSSFLPPTMGAMLDFSLDLDGQAARHGLAAASSARSARLADRQRLLRVYQSGDTLIHEALHEIPRRYPDVDLALLHLGGTRIAGILLTMDGAQGVEAMRIVRPELAIPIHYDDYDVFKSPLADFVREVRAAGLEDRVRYLARGEEHRFRVGPPTPPVEEPAPPPAM